MPSGFFDACFFCRLLQWNLWVLHSQLFAFLREIEHVEDDVLITAVLTVVDGTYHLYDGLSLMYYLGLAVLSDDGQFTLHQYAIVHYGMVVPAQFLTSREDVLHSHQFWFSWK